MNQRAVGTITIAILMLAAPSGSHAACADAHFNAPQRDFAAGSNPNSVALGDFNGDGKPDLAVANSGGNDVSIFLGDGTGTFGAATDFAAGSGPTFVAVADLNADNKPDLVVANPGSNAVSILLGDGTGNFGAATNLAVATNPQSVAVADFNRDGRPDLAVANYGSNNVSILLGDGTGNFGAGTNLAVGTNPQSVAAGDFNRDGKLDLAAANYGSSNVSVLLGDGTGSFGTPTNFAVGTNPVSVAVGDFNRDGIPDLAVANYGSSNVSILLENGRGDVAATNIVGVGMNPKSVAVGDFNGDGKPDLAVARYGKDDVSILLGDGSGNVAATKTVEVGPAPVSLAVGEFNGDGKLDLAVANRNSNNVSILLGSGTGSFGTATNFAVGIFPYSVAAGDFNGDSWPDLAVVISPYVSILMGDGTGYFGATNFAVQDIGGLLSVVVGDLNGDGKADLVLNYIDRTDYGGLLSLLGDGTGNFGNETRFYPWGLWPPQKVAVGDFNGDGKPDLAVADSGGNVSIWLGNGTGGFAATTDCGVGSTPDSVAVGDFNGDGKADLAVANFGSDDVSILLGDGTGSFGAATNFAVGDGAKVVAVGDFNVDGKPDVAVANNRSNNVSILLGDGTGSFGAATNFAVGAYPYSMAVGDFNGDGKPDLAVANSGSNNVSILLGDGTGNFGAATNFGVGVDPDSLAVGDFNGDGAPDVAVSNSGGDDVSILLNTCSPLTQGASCNGNADCASGFCVDNVCCNSACGGGIAGDCQACAVANGAAVDGTCGAVAGGAICRPVAGACDVSETCDGSSLTCPANVFAAQGARPVGCDSGTQACDGAGICTGVAFTPTVTRTPIPTPPCPSGTRRGVQLNGAAQSVDGGTWSLTGNQMTVALWAKVTSLAQPYPTLLSQWDNNDASHAAFVLNTGSNLGQARMLVWTDQDELVVCTSDTSVKLVTNQWHHVAATLDGSHLRCYVDGALAGSAAWPAGRSLRTSPHHIRLGGRDDGKYLKGVLDDVRIYNRGLSAGEIASIYNGCAGSCYNVSNGLVAWWRLDDSCGTQTATDTSGGGHHGTLINGAGLCSSGFVCCLSGAPTLTPSATATSTPPPTATPTPTWNGLPTCSAGGARMGVTTNANLAQSVDGGTWSISGNQMSVALWAKVTSLAVQPYPTLLSKWDNTDPSNAVFALATGNGLGVTRMFVYASDGTLVSCDSKAGGVLATDTWYHVAATLDGSTLRCYVNGALVATGNWPAGKTIRNSTHHVRMAGRDDGKYLSGMLDDVRIYGRGLSAVEIASIYNGNSGMCDNVPANLVAWWKLNDGVGTTAADSSGNGRSATLVNGAAWSDAFVCCP